MNTEIFRDMSANLKNTVAVSESAKRQIAAKVLESKAKSSETRLGPSFLDGFPEGIQNA
jgi:hypothetical protein